MIRAVVFDMGGTLLRFVRPGTGSWRELEAPGMRGVYQYLIEQGHPIGVDEDAFVETLFTRLAEGWTQSTGGNANLRAIDWLSHGMEHHAITLSEPDLHAAIERYAQPVSDGAYAAPGAVELLAALAGQGIRRGLISNTIWPGQMHQRDMQRVGIWPLVEYGIFSGDFGAWKPQPAVFTHVLEQLGVPPHEAVFVGDNPHEDVRGAQAVGMRAVLVRGPEFPAGDVQPDGVIEHDLRELLPMLAQWNAT